MPILTILSFCLFFLAVFFVSVNALSNAHAQNNEPVFFSSLEDIPLMDGLTELNDQTLSFDKPEGRIIESIALITPTLTQEKIIDFYAQTLPQMGWRVTTTTNGASFSRENDLLELGFYEQNNMRFLKLSLKPL